MIALHRLSPRREPFHLNPDLIATVEACPDTVVTLTTGVRVVVAESPRAVTAAVRDWRAGHPRGRPRGRSGPGRAGPRVALGARSAPLPA